MKRLCSIKMAPTLYLHCSKHITKIQCSYTRELYKEFGMSIENKVLRLLVLEKETLSSSKMNGIILQQQIFPQMKISVAKNTKYY